MVETVTVLLSAVALVGVGFFVGYWLADGGRRGYTLLDVFAEEDQDALG